MTSIVGRYLEHPRVFVFGKGEKTKIYIGSADMMTRNTEKRVEVACPVYDEAVKKRLLHQLKVMLADNVKAREMAEDGTYHKKAESGRKINAQETFMQEALHARKEETREMREQKNTGVIKRVLGFFRRRNRRRENKMEKLQIQKFGITKDGSKPYLYKMKNDAGWEVQVSDLERPL